MFLGHGDIGRRKISWRPGSYPATQEVPSSGSFEGVLIAGRETQNDRPADGQICFHRSGNRAQRRKEFEKQPTPDSLTTKQNKNGTLTSKTK